MNLRDAIERDFQRKDEPTAPDLDQCFLCGRTFSRERGHGINNRFCNDLCLDAYDTGYVHREPKPPLGFPVRGDGFLITCRSCKREFVSKGLRCCSPKCDAAYRESIEVAAITAEVGMESTGYVKRTCEHCGNPLPRYVGEGKKRKQSIKRFCSTRCQQAAKRAGNLSDAPLCLNPPSIASDPSEVPVPQQVRSMVTVPLFPSLPRSTAACGTAAGNP
jgi:hypothetical protein